MLLYRSWSAPSRRLDLQGTVVFGRTRHRNFDHQEFWPIFAATSALRAPINLHPQTPQSGVLGVYYTGFGDVIDSLFARAGIGWHYETGMILRLILSGVFDRFPACKSSGDTGVRSFSLTSSVLTCLRPCASCRVRSQSMFGKMFTSHRAVCSADVI